MKTYGLVVLIFGILFELLFTAISLNGSEVSSTVFGVGAFLIVTGWRLRTQGKSIGQRKAS